MKNQVFRVIDLAAYFSAARFELHVSIMKFLTLIENSSCTNRRLNASHIFYSMKLKRNHMIGWGFTIVTQMHRCFPLFDEIKDGCFVCRLLLSTFSENFIARDYSLLPRVVFRISHVSFKWNPLRRNTPPKHLLTRGLLITSELSGLI